MKEIIQESFLLIALTLNAGNIEYTSYGPTDMEKCQEQLRVMAQGLSEKGTPRGVSSMSFQCLDREGMEKAYKNYQKGQKETLRPEGSRHNHE